ncbi:hypothetical protein KY348_05260 [Candidatus Woesearchaeota archaeon]|nr:hypothetical protein [Candidatus Woesearchaeota archaeon]
MKKLEERVEEAPEKTQYRIKKVRKDFCGDRYLQFKSKNKCKINVWRYVPCEGWHRNRYVKGKDCPTSLPYMRETAFLHSLHRKERNPELRLMQFTEKYPNIQDYFDHMNELRDKYLKEKEQESANKKGMIIL